MIDEKGNEQLIGKDYVSKLKLRPKIVGINTTTGERIEFPLLKDARAAGYHPSHLGNALKTGQPYRGYTWSKT